MRTKIPPAILIAVSTSIGILIAILLVEIGLRLANISYPIFTYQDEEGIVRYRPGTDGFNTTENGIYIRINSDGNRDREHSVSKPEGTIRIAVLGDSYAAAFQVELADAFWAVMERELNHCQSLGTRKVEVLNFGVNGYGTGSELLILERSVWKYDPDIILVAFLTGNDVSNNSYDLERNPFETSYFSIIDGKLKRKAPISIAFGRRHPAITNYWRKSVDYSRLLQLLNYVIRTSANSSIRNSARTDSHGLVDALEITSGEIGLDDRVYQVPTRDDWKAAWAVTEALLSELKSAVARRGKSLFIATLSNGIQVDPDSTKRAEYARRLAVDDLYYPDRRVIDFARNAGIPSLMLAPTLLDWAERNRTCVHGFKEINCRGHWNEQGHRVAGETIARELCRQILERQ